MENSIFQLPVDERLPEIGIYNLLQFLKGSHYVIDLAVAQLAMVSDMDVTHLDGKEVHILLLKDSRDFFKLLAMMMEGEE